jgi:hypothetical protein
LERRITGLIDPRRNTMATTGRTTACVVTFLFIAGGAIASTTRFAADPVIEGPQADSKPPVSTTATGTERSDAKQADKPPREADSERTILLHGKVFGPGDRLVAGARLYLNVDEWTDPVELGTSDDNGSYRFVVPEKEPSGDEEKDFADMLAQFKEKIAENLAADDWSSHYDLGLAYKDMGLVDEAIGEFQTALRGGGERLKVYEELGQCFIGKNQYNVAVKLLNRALQMPFDDEADLVGVYYQLGICYEGLGRKEEARESYERVIGLDISFRDVNDRLARL